MNPSIDLPHGCLDNFFDEITGLGVAGEKIVKDDAKEYDLYDPAISFRQWVEIYTKLRVGLGKESWLDVICALLDETEWEQVVQGVDIQKLGAALLYQSGNYARVKQLENWEAIGAEILDFPTSPQNLNKIVEISFWEAVELAEKFSKLGLVGNDVRLIWMFKQIDAMSRGLSSGPLPNILITGEPGAGKSLLAGIIHTLSGRDGKFESVNCAAIPENLLESTFFGHVAGAFTDAASDKQGILEACNKGTVFLDEIDKMNSSHRGKVLHALEERKIRKTGEAESIDIDVLFVVATNQDLKAKLASGEFPRDLYARISAEVFDMPSLEYRVDDVPLLVKHFLNQFPDSSRRDYRLPLSIWCKEKVDKKQISSVRKLRDVVQSIARRLPRVDPREVALRRAIDEAKNSGIQTPITQGEIVRHIEWKGKKKISRSNLYNPGWREATDRLIQENLIQG